MVLQIFDDTIVLHKPKFQNQGYVCDGLQIICNDCNNVSIICDDAAKGDICQTGTKNQ